MDDTLITCHTTVPSVKGDWPMRVDFGELVFNDPVVFPKFRAFDHADYSVASVTPGAGAYQFTTWTSVTGVFEDFGQPRCRFGSWMGTGGTVVNNSYVALAACAPLFPQIFSDFVLHFLKIAHSALCLRSILRPSG